MRKINVRYLLNYFIVIILTSLIFATVLIALPLTEKLSSRVTYDLNIKTDQYWAKEYTLELDFTDVSNKEGVVDKVESVIYRRLSKFGVEKIDTNSYTKDDKQYITFLVQSSLYQPYVDDLIRSPFRLTVVTRNTETDFEDPENPYAVYLEESYIKTDFTKNSFRNVYVTKLKNSANEYSYFALFKAWPWNKEWNDFLSNNQGQEVGLDIDGFVTPLQIPSSSPLVFAVPVSTADKQEAELVSILYNSGVVPVPYTVVDQQNLPIENIEGDYIKIIEGVILAVIVIYAYLLLVEKTKKRILVESALATVITISAWIAYLKISSTPVDIFLLAIEVLTMVAVLRITTENKESRIIVNVLLALVASLVAILGTGFTKIFASDLLALLILGIFSQEISIYYTNKVRKIVKI